MKDAKHIHREQLNRPADSWQDGWEQRETFALGIVWGIAIVLAMIAFM